MSSNERGNGVPRNFRLVEASKLSPDDEFIKYCEGSTWCHNSWMYWFKTHLVRAIEAGLKDFYKPIYEPSLDWNGRICYRPGMKPLVGQSYNWWEEKAGEIGCRLGSPNEYYAYLAVLIKQMYESSNYFLKEAMYCVCEHSERIWHYADSPNHIRDFELTGSRGMCGWFDNGNSKKILAMPDKGIFVSMAGGSFDDFGDDRPLWLISEYDCYRDEKIYFGTGWLVKDI